MIYFCPVLVDKPNCSWYKFHSSALGKTFQILQSERKSVRLVQPARLLYCCGFASHTAVPSVKVRTRPHASQSQHAGRMHPLNKREAGVWHQTRSLLYKNLLIKWRTKQQSLQVPNAMFFLINRFSELEEYAFRCSF